MRDIAAWRERLRRQFATHLENAEQAHEIYELEIGLRLLEKILPGESARVLWTLLTGYDFYEPRAAAERQMIFNARQFLGRFRSQYAWENALKKYRKITASLRGYEICGANNSFRQVERSAASGRWRIYDELLTTKLPYDKRRFVWAEAGEYSIKDRREDETYGIKIPENLVFDFTPQHQLTEKRTREPLAINIADLCETAAWMDEQEAAAKIMPQDWQKRLEKGVKLKAVNSAGRLELSDNLTIGGVLHLAGMVSSGKSTLMTVLAVWAARRGLHVTLLVNDVIGALNQAQQFNRFAGVVAAPILGSDRKSHLNRLHRILAREQPETPLAPDHNGFRWLSTACPLDALRLDTPKEPLALDFRPCLNLKRSAPKNDDEETDKNANQKSFQNSRVKIACPLFPVCPFHRAQRELTNANIWIATPASLVYTAVPAQINPENLRFAELVAQRSDLVVVDEADRVQIQLDEIFSPHEILFTTRSDDGWLDQLERFVGERTAGQGRGFVNEVGLEEWRQSFHKAQDMADLVFRRLRDQKVLQDWIKNLDSFTDVTLFALLTKDLSGDKKTQKRETLRRIFDKFVDEALPEIFGRQIDNQNSDRNLQQSAGELSDSFNEKHKTSVRNLQQFARELLTAGEAANLHDSLCKWIEKNKAVDFGDANELPRVAVKLEFAIAVAVLSNRLNVLLSRWQQVAVPLRLEEMTARLSFSSPFDYQGLLPGAPMSNTLAFQFLADEKRDAKTLRFYRCTAIGRWLMLNLHQLLHAESIAGPNVLLLSGTSWAGKTPAYHVQTTVGGVLSAPDREKKEIADSRFEFLDLRDKRDQPIFVSGKEGDERYEALRKMLTRLAETGQYQSQSRFEAILDSLEPARRRLLLVVGSYREAEIAREHLETFSRWRASVVQLVPDVAAWSEGESANTLRRGLVDRFAETRAELLIAPLQAIERGHNILVEMEDDNAETRRVAAIGAAFFLVRPHPQPRDLAYAVRSLNSWAIEKAKELPGASIDLNAAAWAWRREAQKLWRKLLTRHIAYKNLREGDERDQLTWHLLVSIWQVVGRLVRGGVPALVYFCDAAFYPAYFDPKSKSPSLLIEMRKVLEKYFDGEPPEFEIVRELYEPLYKALSRMKL